MKADNQTMDRQIPLRVQRRKKLIRAAKWLGGFLVVMASGAWLGSQMLTTLDRKALVISEVDRGTIEVSVTATGRIVPAFEEVITSPISSRILEVYAQSGDSVDVGTPLLRLDLLSTETELRNWKPSCATSSTSTASARELVTECARPRRPCAQPSCNSGSCDSSMTTRCV